MPAVIVGPASAALGISRAAVLGAFSGAIVISGICAPRMGRFVDRHGGRGLLAASTIVLAGGLALLAAAHGPVLWYAGWGVLGIGMGIGLYDAAFATAGRLLGAAAAPTITGITLVAGFASTVFWPLGVALVGALGWRGTLAVYAALHLAANLPMLLWLVPKAGSGPPPPGPPPNAAHAGGGARLVRAAPRSMLVWLSGFFTLRWLITSAIAVYVLQLFQGLGLTPREAVLAASLIGPGQVLGRILEWSVGKRVPLLARARLGAALFPAGALMLLAGGPVAAICFALLYGMSNGIMTIHRGTLPLALFGAAGYAARIGWLALPVQFAQAAAPTLAAPVVAALSARQGFALAATLGAVAFFLLLPLRLATHRGEIAHAAPGPEPPHDR
ncbi:MAG: MFS transporter [Rhodospirillales bacterium]|nr:MFS transporter [Rhodospirillales bacterium]